MAVVPSNPITAAKSLCEVARLSILDMLRLDVSERRKRVVREEINTMFASLVAKLNELSVPSGLAKHEREGEAASIRLGAWMSAMLRNDTVCERAKADIRAWLAAGRPSHPPAADERDALVDKLSRSVEALRTCPAVAPYVRVSPWREVFEANAALAGKEGR